MTDQEKKQRIEELRSELRELQATPRSDWHTAFEAFLRFSTYRYKGVTIRTENEVGSDAPRTDYLILTEDETQEFEEPFFRIFRKINVLEYKNRARFFESEGDFQNTGVRLSYDRYRRA